MTTEEGTRKQDNMQVMDTEKKEKQQCPCHEDYDKSEHSNQWLEGYLRALINHRQTGGAD
jgi:hypothetical protein